MAQEKVLLVIGAQSINYTELFKDSKVNGQSLRVEHCTWNDLSLVSHASNGGLVCTMTPSPKPLPGTDQNKARHCTPDFILLRAGCRGDALTDWRFKLSTIAHSSIPTLNSIDSFYASQDKAYLYGKLMKVKRNLKKQGIDFPLVTQSCYSDWKSAGFPPDCPCVGKVGTASGGLGKMRINSSAEWEDFVSVMTMQPQYFTSEGFVKWDWDIRIQKIGNHYRAFRRSSKHWKSNVDMSMKDEDIEVEERYKTWLDEAARECGMDICAMDVLRVEESGKEYILELNSSAIGLNGRHKDADSIHIRDLVLRKFEKYLKESAVAVSPFSSDSVKIESNGKGKGKGGHKDSKRSERLTSALNKVSELEEELSQLREQLKTANSTIEGFTSEAATKGKSKKSK